MLTATMLGVVMIITTSLLHNLPLTIADNMDLGPLDSDRKYLLVFSNALSGVGKKPNWTPEDNVADICKKWIGITCTHSMTGKARLADPNRVARLSLPARGLEGPIVANSIGKLDALEYLSLRSNRLNGTIPQDMLSIRTLQYIQLQHNNFSGDFPAFRKSENLSLGLISVDLSYNSFTGKIPDLLPMLRQLRFLSLENNFFSGTVPDFISCTLTMLNLTYNTLEGEIPYSLKNFSKYSFIGNQLLCGEPLMNCPERAPAPAPLSNIAPPCSEKIGAITFVASLIIMFLLV